MIQSRCGICCNNCDFKSNCMGCINISKPFWGDICPVKSCCEGKNHRHCGECSDFPCATLHAFAYDKEQGDNGERIRQCINWRESER